MDDDTRATAQDIAWLNADDADLLSEMLGEDGPGR